MEPCVVALPAFGHGRPVQRWGHLPSGHFYAALKGKKIHTYMDDKSLEREMKVDLPYWLIDENRAIQAFDKHFLKTLFLCIVLRWTCADTEMWRSIWKTCNTHFLWYWSFRCAVAATMILINNFFLWSVAATDLCKCICNSWR